MATIQALERGRGQTGSLRRALAGTAHQFAAQPDEFELGQWLADLRRRAGLSQQTFASRLHVSKPTVIQIERGAGNLTGLLAALALHGLEPQLRPQENSQLDLRCGDCLSLLPTLPPASIDAIVSDLPYGALRALPWDRKLPLDVLWTEFRRVLKPTGVVVLTASQPFTSELVQSNREWFKYTLVWQKTKATGFYQAKHMPLRAHEDVCIFSPGVLVGKNRSQRQMTFNPQGLIPLERPRVRENGWRRGTYVGDKFGYPTTQTHTNYPQSVMLFASEVRPLIQVQKPVELMAHLTKTYSHPGDIILDLCMGSGTTGVACVQEGRRFVGFEIDPEMFEIASARIRSALPRNQS